MRYSGGSCGPTVLILFTLFTTGAVAAEPYAAEPGVIASFKADLKEMNELLTQAQNELLETRDEVDALREEIAALTARLGSTHGAAMVSQDRHGAIKLAETYDPKRLAAWSVVGLRGDPQKARELYQQARAGGVRQAQERISELR